jgi:hypothetical protein
MNNHLKWIFFGKSFNSFHLSFVCCVLFFGLSFTACQKPQTVSIPLDLTRQNKDFKYMDARFKVNYKDSDNKANTAKVRLRMKKDSLIWVSVTGPVGVEGIRALIRKDSIFIIDRIAKNFITAKFDTLGKIFNFDFTYEMVQSVLLAEMPFAGYESTKKSDKGKTSKIEQKVERLEVENELINQYQKLESLFVKDLISKNTMKMTFDEYAVFDGEFFPKLANIQINYKNPSTQKLHKTIINLSITKIELPQEPLTFPFTIPTNNKYVTEDEEE